MVATSVGKFQSKNQFWQVAPPFLRSFDELEHHGSAMRFKSDRFDLLLYIGRWLKATVQMEDGSIVRSMAGTPRSNLTVALANIYLHYAFDMWMARTHPHIPLSATRATRTRSCGDRRWRTCFRWDWSNASQRANPV